VRRGEVRLFARFGGGGSLAGVRVAPGAARALVPEAVAVVRHTSEVNGLRFDTLLVLLGVL
jgi:hypothetical protein